MKDYTNYRITVNGVQSKITREYLGKEWSEIARIEDQRGGIDAIFEEQLITDSSILPMLSDSKGYLKLKNDIIICPWEIKAEFKNIN